MKKLLIALGVIILIFLNLWQGISRRESSSTIEDAIIRAGYSVSRVIYLDKLELNDFVLYIDKHNKLSGAFITKTPWGFKYGYGGSVELSSSKALSFAYLKKEKGSPFSVMWGKINNNSIAKVYIVDKDKIYDGKILNTKYGRLWLVYINEINKENIKIEGKDSMGKILFTDSIDFFN